MQSFCTSTVSKFRIYKNYQLGYFSYFALSGKLLMTSEKFVSQARNVFHCPL